MSSAIESSTESPAIGNPAVEAPAIPPTSAPRRGVAWVWALIACVLLGASGAARAVQESRHRSEKAYRETCPFDLQKIPESFGDEWKLIRGGERKLDEQTMKITGGTDHLIRTYANDLTGVFVTIMILFGPAEPVLPHTPQVCYPATGFQPGEPPTLRTIAYPIGNDAQGRPAEGKADFQMATYTKPNGRQTLREAVYHSYRLDGVWSPFIGQGRKFPRRNPSIFKVQIHRMVADGETIAPGDPLEQFLQKFVAEVEAEIKAAGAQGVAAKKADG